MDEFEPLSPGEIEAGLVLTYDQGRTCYSVLDSGYDEEDGYIWADLCQESNPAIVHERFRVTETDLQVRSQVHDAILLALKQNITLESPGYIDHFLRPLARDIADNMYPMIKENYLPQTAETSIAPQAEVMAVAPAPEEGGEESDVAVEMMKFLDVSVEKTTEA